MAKYPVPLCSWSLLLVTEAGKGQWNKNIPIIHCTSYRFILQNQSRIDVLAVTAARLLSVLPHTLALSCHSWARRTSKQEYHRFLADRISQEERFLIHWYIRDNNTPHTGRNTLTNSSGIIRIYLRNPMPNKNTVNIANLHLDRMQI